MTELDLRMWALDQAWRYKLEEDPSSTVNRAEQFLLFLKRDTITVVLSEKKQ